MDAEEIEERVAARIVLADADGRTLLFRGGDPSRPDDGTWWFTPGGGVETGESIEEAGRRELYEETGLRVDELGTVVYERDTEFPFCGRLLRQHESYFVVRVDEPSVDTAGWTELERRTVDEYRWWSIEELRTTGDVFYPKNLIALLDLIQR